MEAEGLREREHGMADILVLLSIICLTLVTWAFLADGGVALWKPIATVAIWWPLALAALTRHRRWSAVLRLLLGGWIIAAPHLLNFAAVGPVCWSYLATGALIVATSIPDLAARRAARFGLEGRAVMAGG